MRGRQTKERADWTRKSKKIRLRQLASEDRRRNGYVDYGNRLELRLIILFVPFFSFLKTHYPNPSHFLSPIDTHWPLPPIPLRVLDLGRVGRQGAGHVNDEAELDVVLLQPNHGLVGVRGGDELDHRDDVVPAREVEHGLRLGDAPDDGAACVRVILFEWKSSSVESTHMHTHL